MWGADDVEEVGEACSGKTKQAVKAEDEPGHGTNSRIKAETWQQHPTADP
jgi:hypothetical protein